MFWNTLKPRRKPGARTLSSGVLLLLAWSLPCFSESPEMIAPPQVHKWQIQGELFMLIDLRKDYQFKNRHIVGAVNIPVPVIADKNLPKEFTLVLYDNDLSMATACRGEHMLREKGYTKVKILNGGLQAWRAAHLPISAKMGLVPTIADYVTPEDLHQYLLSSQGAALLIDLRPVDHFKKFHVPGSQNIPLPSDVNILSPNGSVRLFAPLAQAVKSVTAELTIVLMDGNGVDARLQAEVLTTQGLIKTRYLDGGLENFRRMLGQETLSPGTQP